MSVQRIRQAAQLMAKATTVVSLTGAGVSTSSGIPDFRSSHSGLWANVDPMVVASIWGFRANPQAFYDWFLPLASLVLDALPNSAHLALAELGELGRMSAVITQNIDGLHQRAGSRRVLELHGHLREALCMECNRMLSSEGPLQELLENRRAPRCPECRGVLKPAAVLFGELLPQDILRQAQAASENCEVMLVAGSSLEVAPAADLPVLAHRAGARLVIVNYQPTPLDSLAQVVIQEDVAAVLPAIVRQVKGILATDKNG